MTIKQIKLNRSFLHSISHIYSYRFIGTGKVRVICFRVLYFVD